MDNKVLRQRLAEIHTTMMTDALQASVMLSAVIDVLDEQMKPVIPEWSNSQGMIDPDAIDDHTFDNGPIVIKLVRTHEIYTNACYLGFEGIDAICNEQLLDQFQESFGSNHSYEDDGERVPDEYMIKVLVGRDPEPKVRFAFLNGNLVIEGLDDKDYIEQVFRNWKAFYEKEPVHLGIMVEEEGCST